MVTLDLNGSTVTNTNDIWNTVNGASEWSLVSVNGGELTIKNGTLKAKDNDCYGVDVRNGGKLILDNVNVIGNISAVYCYDGEIVIKDGDYSIVQLNTNGVQDSYGVTINCYDSNYKNGIAKITISGGTFHGFDPGKNQAESGTKYETSFLADGYKSQEAGTDEKGLTIYEVVKA